MSMRITAPTYTQTPNDLFDHWLPLLGEVELKVLLVIMRKTFGWHKTRDKISISQLQVLTGSVPKNILRATKFLVSKGLIKKEVFGPAGKQETYYELIVNEDSNNSYPCRGDSPTPSDSTAPPLSRRQSQKKLPKENKKEIDDDLTPEAGKEKKDLEFVEQSTALDHAKFHIPMLDGSVQIVTAEEIFSLAVQKKMDWTTNEIRIALYAIKNSCPIIRDLVRYIDGVIKNHRKQNKPKIKVNKEKQSCSKNKYSPAKEPQNLNQQSEQPKKTTLASATSGRLSLGAMWEMAKSQQKS